jgi:DNA-binding transcriptional LysR family regulator
LPLRHVTLRQLAVFEALAQHRSFSAAAKAMHLTQPAVSMQVRQLEAAAGVALVERIGKRIDLTEAGVELARCARDVQARLKDADDAVAAIRGLRGGQLDIAVVSTAKYFAPHLLAEFRRRHPGVTLRLTVSNRQAVLSALSENRSDLAIMGQPPRGLAVDAAVFAKHPLAIIAPPTHPLAGKKRLLLEALANEDFLIREPGSGTRGAMERFFAQHGVRLHPSTEMSSNETIKQAVMAGMGIAFLSMHTIGLELKARRLVTLPVAGTPVMRNWHVIHLRRKRLSPIAQGFKEFLRDEGAALVRKTVGFDAG